MGVLQNFQKFRVRVWKRYRTHRSSGYCGMGVQNSPKFRAGAKEAVPVPRVLWHGAYRTHRSSKYGYECPTRLTEVPGTGMKVFIELPKVPGIVARAYRTYRSSGQVQKCCTRTSGILARSHRSYISCGYGYEFRTELTEVLCTGMDVVQNSQKFRVWVIPAGKYTPSGGELDFK